MKVSRNGKWEEVEFGEFHNLFTRWVDTFFNDAELKFTASECAPPPGIQRVVWSDDADPGRFVIFFTNSVREEGTSMVVEYQIRFREPVHNVQGRSVFTMHDGIAGEVAKMLRPIANYLRETPT